MRAWSALLVLLPVAATAHPHVFVDSRMEVVLQDGAVTAVRLTWTYDAFFSLMLTEDLGLDPDGDGVLTAAELDMLAATILDWPPEFGGDLVVSRGGEEVALGPRQDHRLDFVDGRMVETHLRPLAAPLLADLPVTIENFDPYYYVSYTVHPEVILHGAEGCAMRHVPADPLAAQAEIDRLWQGLDIANAPPEVTLPPVGYAFADRVEILCGA